MIDILTGMVIMSIIIAMVFYLFTALNKQLFTYGQTHNQLNRYLMMRTDISRQCDLADEIIGIPNGFKLIGNSEKLAYIKSDSYLLRISDKTTDTLSYNLTDLSVKFLPNKSQKNSELIHQIDLKIELKQQALTCRFYKNYPLNAQMNFELLNEL